MNAISRINAMSEAEFVAAFGALYEHSPWAAELAFGAGPFRDANALFAAMSVAVAHAPAPVKLALIKAHPELAGEAVRARALTQSSHSEQAGAGLDRLDAQEAALFDDLNARYRARHGFPFIICVREHTKAQILEAMQARLDNDSEAEVSQALAQIDRIARLRFADAIARIEAAA